MIGWLTFVFKAPTPVKLVDLLIWLIDAWVKSLIDWIDWWIDWRLSKVWMIDFTVCVLQPVTCVTRASTLGQDCGNIGWSTRGRDLTGIVSSQPTLFSFSCPILMAHSLFTVYLPNLFAVNLIFLVFNPFLIRFCD